MTESELIFDADNGSAFAAVAEVPVIPAAWRYDRSRPWQEPQPHIWTPERAPLAPGVVWVVCARTRTGNRSMRVYPLRHATGASIALVGAACLSARPLRLTRRQVLLHLTWATIVPALWQCSRPGTAEPAYRPPDFRLAAWSEGQECLLAVPHAGVALYGADVAKYSTSDFSHPARNT